MSKYIDAERLTVFVQARRDRHYNYFVKNGVGCIAEYKYDEDVELLDLINSLQQEQPSLPSNMDEAAKKIAYDVCKALPNGEEKDTVVYYAILAAIAGAKWMAEQGISCEAEAVKDIGISFLKESFEKATKEFDGKIIVQIRKK